jgi:FixJ family two-component response regulator
MSNRRGLRPRRKIGAPPRRLVVAVVEDHESLRVAIGRLLLAAGYETALFDSAEAYLAEPPGDVGCVLLDIGLPGMSGLDLHHRLRSSDSASPAIILTTADRSLEGKGEALGCDALLLKPVVPEQLLTAIGSLVKRP